MLSSVLKMTDRDKLSAIVPGVCVGGGGGGGGHPNMEGWGHPNMRLERWFPPIHLYGLSLYQGVDKAT